jgi:Family of unknown function (DUF6350)
MTGSAIGAPRPAGSGAAGSVASGPGPGADALSATTAAAGLGRPLVITGAMAACGAAGTGLVVVTLLVVVGWVAAPHAGIGLTGVLRTAAVLWLIGHHVGFALPRAGRIGMLPLGLVLLPGALLWHAGRRVVRSGGIRRIRHVGYAALALAVPYALLAGALALASRSPLASPSLPEAVLSSFLLALTAGGLGGARALAPWAQLTALLPARVRSLTVATTAAMALFTAAGGLLAGASLATHLGTFTAVSAGLDPGPVGTGLLLLAQLAYVPNAVIWAISFTLGPGFAFGTGTVVSPTGSALGKLPELPMLAALPPGVHAVPPVLSVAVLAVPYLAGAFGGLLLVRAAPTPTLEGAPLWGFASGTVTGALLGLLAAFSGGPLGNGRLAAVGPSSWQVAMVAALQVGVAAAIAAGVANWLRLRGAAARARPDATAQAGAAATAAGTRAVPATKARARSAAAARPAASGPGWARPAAVGGGTADNGHVIYVDPWAERDPGNGPGSAAARGADAHGPTSIPRP